MRTITKARWIPDIPTVEGIEEVIKDTGIEELVPIESFNLVTVREKKRDTTPLVVVTAMAPVSTVLITAEILMQNPLMYGLLATVSIFWAVLVMTANLTKKRKSRNRG